MKYPAASIAVYGKDSTKTCGVDHNRIAGKQVFKNINRCQKGSTLNNRNNL